MKSLFSIGLLLILALGAFANVIYVPLENAVRENDLIIVGTLTEINERIENHSNLGRGEIVVKEVIAGYTRTQNDVSLNAGDRLELNYDENSMCLDGSHKRIENEKGVFLLRFNSNGEIKAKDFRILDNLEDVRWLLRDNAGLYENVKLVKTIESEQEQLRRIEKKMDFDQRAVLVGVQSDIDATKRRLLAFLVFLGSVFLYFVLYRSRLKIS